MSRPYNYTAFYRELFEEDHHFGDAPAPGEPAPEIDLPTVGGGRFRSADLVGKKPLLLSFASFT